MLCPLQPGHAAQQAGLARARDAKQHANALAGQAHIHVQHKVRARQAQPDLQGRSGRRPHTATRLAPRLNQFSPKSTANENTSMPAASQWACAYSMASTWP